MSASESPCYTLIHVPNDTEFPSEQQLKEKFEKGDIKAKTEALKKLILMLLNGEKMSPSLMMHVIRFCLPADDHMIKKLLLNFWEAVPKVGADGKLLHEMILVCDAFRKDLQHPNEFLRGSTLRFLCKLKEPELLEPLIPSIRLCLEHSHSYVRRNAVLAIFAIYSSFDFLISDAPELIYNYLETEQDASCKRNAFIMLTQVDQARAVEFLVSCIEQVPSFNDILQLIIIELIYKVCHGSPKERGNFIMCVYKLLQSSSAAVRYDAAGTLVALSQTSAAVKTAAQTYIDLIVKQPDNNVKLIVLDRLIDLREHASNERVLQELVMDILRVLSSSDYDVRQKILQLALDLVSNRNVAEMVMFLKKEINKTTNETQEDIGRYRQLLVRTLHKATMKFKDVADQIFPVLMEFLSDQSETAAADVLVFIREAIQRMPERRDVIIEQLLEVFGTIRNISVYRSALWILCEYSESTEHVGQVYRLIKKSIGELPIFDTEEALLSGDAPAEVKKEEPKIASKPKQLVTADGTYATQSALSSATVASTKDDRPILRKALIDGNFFNASALATSLSKLFFRFASLNKENPAKINQFGGDIVFLLSSICRFGKSSLVKSQITEDDLERISTTISIIVDRWPEATQIFLQKCRISLDLMLDAKGDIDRHEEVREKKHTTVQVDDPIHYTQLSARIADGTLGTNLIDLSLSQALGTAPKTAKYDFASTKLGKVVQLSGFSDPVYAEAYINVNQYDIVLDVLVVNQSADTLQNLSLELSTVGDLKLVDKPTPLTLAAHDFANIKATVKVTSTENGIIFSTISYDVRGTTSDRLCVYLQDIRIDIMDYIVPGSCTDTEFRQMWIEFEWENKVTVTTQITDLKHFMQHIAESTNMKLLTADAALEGDCGFLAANFCAHSIFGEDALANISIEKADHADPNSSVIGHIRIRAKSQGMALSLGDKINAAQREKPKQHLPIAA